MNLTREAEASDDGKYEVNKLFVILFAKSIIYIIILCAILISSQRSFDRVTTLLCIVSVSNILFRVFHNRSILSIPNEHVTIKMFAFQNTKLYSEYLTCD